MKFKLKYSILSTESDGEYDGVLYDSFEAAERARVRAIYKERKQYGDNFIIWIEEVLAMTLHELWEHVDSEELLYYECMDYENECVRIAEYDGAERFTTGSHEVFSIKPYFIAGVGNVILATLMQNRR